MKLNFIKMTKREYFDSFGLRVSKDTLKEIKNVNDIDNVFDAFYLRSLFKKTNYVDELTLEEYLQGKKTSKDYFEGKLDNVDCIDLSESMSSTIWHYLKDELSLEDTVETSFAEIIDIEDGDKYLFELN